MSILEGLLGSGIGGIGDAFKKIVGTFKLDPEVKAQIEAEIERNKFELAKIDAELESKLADIQGQNIRAETQSEDGFVRRARPAFLWMMTFGIGFAIIVFPLVNLFRGGPPLVLDIPDGYLSLFGVGFLGYTGARSWEKSQLGKK